MIPFTRVKFPFFSMPASWVFGVYVFDLDFGVQIDSIEQPIKSNSVGSGNMSHCRASSLYNHLDHCFVVFKHIQTKLPDEKNWTFEGIKSTLSKSLITLRNCLRLWIVWGGEQISLELTTGLPVLSWFWVVFPRTETIRYHKSSAGIPSNLNPAHTVPPEVDFESSRSPAKPESWNSPSLHCFAVLPTEQYCLYSHVWWM